MRVLPLWLLSATVGAHNPGLAPRDKVVSEKTTDYGAFKSTHGEAGAAAALGVPWVAIRIVSVSEDHHPAWERIAGQHCAEFVVEVVRSLP